MKLEVGMYIRTDEGFIAKVKEFKHDYTKGKRLVDDYSVKEVIENYLSLDGNQCRLIESIDYSIPPCYPSDEELEKIKSHIVKSSHNIIDIVQVGDYVNGCYVSNKRASVNEHLGGHPKGIGIIKCNAYFNQGNYDDCKFVWIEEKDIKSIVTKEQFSAMEYRLGDK